MEFLEVLGWAGATALIVAIVFGLIYIARWEISERRQKDAGPWIGYTLKFTNGPQAGRSYRVKSVQDGFVVLDELEE